MPNVRVSDPSKTAAVVKRAFYLAFVACGGAVGMGVFQDRGPGVTEDQVWKNVQNEGDYTGAVHNNRPGHAYGDYVFGRMMKLSVEWDERKGTINVPGHAPQADYQGWSSGKPRVESDVPRVGGVKYPSYMALFEAAAQSLGVTLGATTEAASV